MKTYTITIPFHFSEITLSDGYLAWADKVKEKNALEEIVDNEVSKIYRMYNKYPVGIVGVDTEEKDTFKFHIYKKENVKQGLILEQFDVGNTIAEIVVSVVRK